MSTTGAKNCIGHHIWCGAELWTGWMSQWPALLSTTIVQRCIRWRWCWIYSGADRRHFSGSGFEFVVESITEPQAKICALEEYLMGEKLNICLDSSLANWQMDVCGKYLCDENYHWCAETSCHDPVGHREIGIAQLSLRAAQILRAYFGVREIFR